MNEKQRSLLQQIFGDDMGEFLQVILIYPIIMLAIVGVPELIDRITQKPDTQTELLAQLPKNSQDLIQELAAVQIKTQKLIHKLEADSSKAEGLLQDKQKALDELQNKISLLQLTPAQRELVEQYNKSISTDLDFRQWASRKTTWFEVGVAILIGWFFYFLGIRRGRKYESQENINNAE